MIVCLVFPIPLIVRACTIAQIVSDCIHYLRKHIFRLSSCRSFLSPTFHILLLWHNCCLSILSWRSCHSGLSIHMILDLFPILFVDQPVCFSTVLCQSIIIDHKLRNAPNPQMLSASKPLSAWFTSWHHCVDRYVNFLYVPTRSGKKLFFVALTIVSWVNFVVGQDVWCCKIWTTCRQAVSFMSRLVRVINLNTARPAFWLSHHWDW